MHNLVGKELWYFDMANLLALPSGFLNRRRKLKIAAFQHFLDSLYKFFGVFVTLQDDTAPIFLVFRRVLDRP